MFQRHLAFMNMVQCMLTHVVETCRAGIATPDQLYLAN